MQAGTEQLVEQPITVMFVIDAGNHGRLRQHQFAGESQSGGGGGRQPGMIGLQAADGDHGVDLLAQGLAEMEFEFAQLVAATAEGHEIITLEIQPDAAGICPQDLFKAMGPLDRGRTVQQRGTRKRSEGVGKRAGHGRALGDLPFRVGPHQALIKTSRVC